MKIATTERGPRTHQAAGKSWTFESPNSDGPAVCDVTDPDAAAIFLKHDKVFRCLDPAVPLQRQTDPPAPAKPATPDQPSAGSQGESGQPAQPAPSTEAIEHDAKELVELTVRELRNTLAKVPFPLATLQRALVIENASGDKARAAVIASLESAIQRAQAG